jgi:hypothetical protein
MNRSIIRAGLVLAIAACAVPQAVRPADAQAPRGAQERLTREELHLVACAAMQLPSVRAAFARGAAPLLVVSGRPSGPLRAPRGPCPEPARLPRGATEFRFLEHFAAPQLYGRGARHGAVLIDLPAPRPAVRPR